jgi:hypothetical protein
VTGSKGGNFLRRAEFAWPKKTAEGELWLSVG